MIDQPSARWAWNLGWTMRDQADQLGAHRDMQAWCPFARDTEQRAFWAAGWKRHALPAFEVPST